MALMATIAAAGAMNIANRLKKFAIGCHLSILINTSENALKLIKNAIVAIKNNVTSLSDTFSNPTIIPNIPRTTTIHVSIPVVKIAKIMDNTRPIKNAHTPTSSFVPFFFATNITSDLLKLNKENFCLFINYFYHSLIILNESFK